MSLHHVRAEVTARVVTDAVTGESTAGAIAPVDLRMIGYGLTPSEVTLLDCILVASHEPMYAKLYALGIHGPTATGGGLFRALHCDSVCFLPGGRFEFARNMRDASGHVLAVIIPALDEYCETIDLVAWSLETGAFATWRGQAAMLGEDGIDAPRIEVDGLRVFPGPAEWLRAGRRGVVILDNESARWRLCGETLIVSEAGFGRRLRDALRLSEPRVFVEEKRRAA
jgi:hypothetical protein